VADGKVGGDHRPKAEPDQLQRPVTDGERIEQLLELAHVVADSHRPASAVRPSASSHVVGEDAAAARLEARNERPPHVHAGTRHAVYQDDDAFTLLEPPDVEVIACETIAAQHDLLVARR